MQHGPIPHARSGSRARRVEQRADLLAVKMANECLIGLLDRDGTNLASLLDAGRHTVLQKMEERVDCSQPGVARTGRASPLGFNVFEECKDKWHIQLLDCQLGRSDFEAI